jgi:hypothetical protein
MVLNINWSKHKVLSEKQITSNYWRVAYECCVDGWWTSAFSTKQKAIAKNGDLLRIRFSLARRFVVVTSCVDRYLQLNENSLKKHFGDRLDEFNLMFLGLILKIQWTDSVQELERANVKLSLCLICCCYCCWWYCFVYIEYPHVVAADDKRAENIICSSQDNDFRIHVQWAWINYQNECISDDWIY